MATADECEKAFRTLADRLAASDPEHRKRHALDRSLSCRLPDIDTVFAARLKDGLLSDIRRVADATAEVKLTMSSDDLVALVDGDLKFASAWASGRIKIDARVFDLIKMRSIF